MPEVIELLSSSPPPCKGEPAGKIAHNNLTDQDIFNFGSDDFNTTVDLDFVLEQAPKRRKLSSEPVLPTNCKATHVVDDVFDLSSEGDLLPALSKINERSTAFDDVEHASHTNDNNIFRFSSSAPEPTLIHVTKEPFVIDTSSEHGSVLGDPIQTSSQAEVSSRPVFSERTTNLLAGLRTSTSTLSKHVQKGRAQRSSSADISVNKMTRFKKITKSFTATGDDIIDSSQPYIAKGKQKTVSLSVENDKQVKAGSNSKSKAERDAEKEAEKERKRKEKELRVQEKQKAADIAEVNKSKTNKKNSTPEMIFDMPASLQGLSLGNQIEEYMKQLNVQVTFSGDEEVSSTSGVEVAFGNIITWRRKVTADYDEDLEIWRPLDQPRVTREKHVLVYLKAEDFVNLAVIGDSTSITDTSEVSGATMKSNLDAHVKSVRTKYPESTVIYLIEGLVAWNRKSQTVKNRAYTAAVRSQVLDNDESNLTVPAPSQSKRTTKAKRKKSIPAIDLSFITSDITEDLLLHLQLHHQPLLIHHTTSVAMTASQITAFTQHLSTRPYRLAEQNHNLVSASFCMTTGQIRTGATPHETYINMLQEINRVTPSMAYGVSNAGYRNVGELVRGFRRDGNLMLEDVRKSVNKDGGWSDRRLGPMVSKRLFKVFMGRDPGARDGIA